MAECSGGIHPRRAISGLAFLFLLLSVAAAYAQSALSGIVHDPSTRVAVGAIVVADDGSGTQWKTVSNTIGYYEIALPPGEYQVRADLILDSRPLSYTGTILVLSNENTALDINLDYRGVERVTVESPVEPFAPSGALGATFSRESLETLPLTNGRTIQSLLSLVPGIIVTDSVGTLAQFTAAGQRRFANRLTIDGMSADLGLEIVGHGIGEAGSGTLPALSTLGSTQTLVPLAAIEEISVHTTNASPEQQRSSGSQTVIVTRSGSDQFTGSGFVDWRPQGLEANDWFVNAGKAPVRAQRFTTAGASLGGPLYPGRLFYFGAWEYERIARSISTTIHVPSDSTRETASADVRAILDAFPRPNGRDLGDGLAELSYPFPADSGLNNISLRLDANLSERHRLFARVNRGASAGDALTQLQLPLLSSTATESTRTKTATLSLTSVLSASTTHDLRFNVSENLGSLVGGPASYSGAQPLPLPLLVPSAAAGDAWVSVRMPTTSGLLTLQSGRAASSSQKQVEIADAFSHVHGSHTWRLGFTYRRRAALSDGAPNRYTYTFADVSALQQQRVRLLLVQHSAITEALFQTWSTFAQDGWRVSPRLSLDYGVRYDVEPAPTSITDTQPLLIRFETLPQIQPLPTGSQLWKTSWGNVAPHIAATYQLGTASGYETNLRAGWNLVFDALTSPGANAFGWGYPFRSLRPFTRLTFPVSASAVDTPAPATFSNGDLNEYYAFPRHLRSPHVRSWQFGLDQALGHTQRLSLAYAGAAGRDLVYWQGYHVGSPDPIVHAFSNDARSDYHALLLEYVHRLSHGFQTRLSYTWSHAIDTDSGEPLTPHPPATLLSPSSNRGSADFDRRHVLEVAGSYRVPTPRLPKLLEAACANWQIDIVGIVRSGGPVTITSDRTLGSGTYTVRPDVVPGALVWIADSTVPGGRRINPDAFAIPEERQGTLGRNTLRASPLRQVDLSLSRSMRLGDRKTIQIRLDAFNAFNVVNFGPPDGDLGNVGFGFGQPRTSYAQRLGAGSLLFGGLTPLQQVGGPRSIQIGLRFGF